MFENFKILTVGLLVALGFYFLFELPADSGGIPEIKAADTATTQVAITNATPTVSNITLNAEANINLIESSATTVSATATVSDTDTYYDIASVIGRFYRSGVTSSSNCTTDPNNCTPTSTCATSSCSVNDCVVTCTSSLWFIAEPTDAGSTYATQHWVAWIKAVDTENASSSATNTTQEIEMKTLTALDAGPGGIEYGSLGLGETIDPLSILLIATTTGNEAIDANISGYDMCTDYPACVVATTAISYQHYATSSLAYASTSNGVVIASSTAQLLEFETGKPTATTSNQAQNIYWGLSVPLDTAGGDYNGENIIAAQSD